MAALATEAHDHAKSPGMSVTQLLRFLGEIQWQPDWRAAANIEADYYDGNQLDQQTLATLREYGMKEIKTNLIQPTVDLILGMEAKTRRDWRVVGVHEHDDDVAEALTAKLSEAKRITRAERAISDAYADQIKVGLGWVEVARNWDPFGYPYRCQFVHRREIWWDWRARQPDLSDARYLVRKKWYDLDFLIALLPQYAQLIKHIGNGWQSWDIERFSDDVMMARAWETQRSTTSLDELEWLDTERRRACLYEVWYKTIKRGHILRIPGGGVMAFDRANPRHVAAVESGMVRLESAIVPETRVSLWLGPHRLTDEPNPHPFDGFPYVPFFGKREDRTGVPYGAIRNMKSPQDEVNDRRIKMMMLLSAKRVIADEDAIAHDDHESVMMEVARPDAYIKLNSERKNKGADAFRVETDLALNAQQYQVMTDAMQRIQDVAGIYQAMLGEGKTGQSGSAISQLVEQGTTSLAEINDNYEYSRTQVGERLLVLVRHDLAKQTEVKVLVGRRKSDRRTIVLNRVEIDQTTGDRVRTNDTVLAKVHVALSDVPATATFRQQQIDRMTELTKSLPDELQGVIIDLIVEASDLPYKDEIAERIRSQTHMQPRSKKPEEMTPEEREQAQARAEEAQFQQQVAKSATLIELAEGKVKVTKLAAEAQKIQAEIQRQEAEFALKVREQAANTQNTQDQTALDALKLEIEMRKQDLAEVNSFIQQYREMQRALTTDPQPNRPPTDTGRLSA